MPYLPVLDWLHLRLQEVLEALKAQAGAHSSAVLHYLLRFSVLFQRDPYQSAVRLLRPPSSHMLCKSSLAYFAAHTSSTERHARA